MSLFLSLVYDRIDSLFNSVTSAAKASGLAPSSSNCAQMFKVSRSRPVPNKFDISKTTIKLIRGDGGMGLRRLEGGILMKVLPSEALIVVVVGISCCGMGRLAGGTNRLNLKLSYWSIKSLCTCFSK